MSRFICKELKKNEEKKDEEQQESKDKALKTVNWECTHIYGMTDKKNNNKNTSFLTEEIHFDLLLKLYHRQIEYCLSMIILLLLRTKTESCI